MNHIDNHFIKFNYLIETLHLIVQEFIDLFKDHLVQNCLNNIRIILHNF